MRRILFFVLTSTIAVGCNFTVKENSSIEQNPIEEKIKEAMKENNVPSLSIGIIRDGKINVLQGFGTTSRKDTVSFP
jgi:CubicO group peptidase (beta-lactamase class C family)